MWALDAGIVAGAGLDVLEGEEVLTDEQDMFRTPQSQAQLREVLAVHRILERDDLIITPHTAWYSREARERILATTIENIRAFSADRPVHVVSAPGNGAECQAKVQCGRARMPVNRWRDQKASILAVFKVPEAYRSTTST